MPAEGALRDRGDPGFYLIETMRWEPATGVIRHDRHLDRLRHSASAFGFAFDEAAIRDLLATITAPGPSRLRLTLQHDGQAGLETAPFAALPSDTGWRLRIASVRLKARNPLLRHKTSKREIYEAARAEFTREDADEVLLLNDKGHVCEGTITTIFARMADGALITPLLECGLLAGVLRGEMIGSGKASEGILSPDDLLAARELYVGNSLRGLIPAQLVADDGD